MRIPLALSVMLFTAGDCLADDIPSLVGKWVKWNPRTVIGTGRADEVLEVRKGSGEDYFVVYTTGSVERAGVEGGRHILKTTIATYRSLNLRKKGELYVLVVPDEEKQTLYLKYQRDEENDGDLLVLVKEDGAPQDPDSHPEGFRKQAEKKTGGDNGP